MSARPEYSWCLSRYAPEVRARDSPWESWTSVADIGQTFNGVVLTRDEYVRVENLYIECIAAFVAATSTQFLDVAYIGHQDGGFHLREGQRLPQADLGDIVRGGLRGAVDCVLRSSAGELLQIEFDFDLYVRLGASVPCADAVAFAARVGLYLESDAGLEFWEGAT